MASDTKELYNVVMHMGPGKPNHVARVRGTDPTDAVQALVKRDWGGKAEFVFDSGSGTDGWGKIVKNEKEVSARLRVRAWK